MQLRTHRSAIHLPWVPSAAVAMLALYTAAMFLSATLLFMVEPMFAKMVLPLLGGSPSVWNTALVVYQALLFGGYLYAHFTARLLGVRRQTILQLALMLLPILLVLPIRVPGGWSPPTASNPIPWLLLLFAATVGLPFVVVSTMSPLLQSWFAQTGHPAAGDPYFLYAAGNVGSLLGLLAYPILLEPRLRLVQQSHLWTVGYLVLVSLVIACALVVRRTATAAVPIATQPAEEDLPKERISHRRRLRWLMLACVPSSLLLSVTTFMTTGLAPIPLLWVLPLGLYLLTFTLAFSKKRLLPRGLLARAFPFLLLPLVLTLIAHTNQPLLPLIGLHLGAFFVAAMLCHQALADDRPTARHLTEFYLWVSAGGVLGGLFVALLAPLIFSSVVEYPVALVALCLLQRTASGRARAALPWRLDVALPVVLGLAFGAVLITLNLLGVQRSSALAAVALCVGAVACFSFSRRPLRFGLGVAALLIAGLLFPAEAGVTLRAERNFFGIIRVSDVTAAGGIQYHLLQHSGTVHGLQSLDPSHRDQPLTYYFPNGPIGQLFASLGAEPSMQTVGVVGLGAGSLACYSHPGQSWTFYEIDPAIVRLAQDPQYFTFLSDCAPNAQIVLGDARLSLVKAPNSRYDLLVLDAYSSDTVPVHLLTREALALYLSRLSPHGVLAFHISNRYLDLKPVLGNLAQDAGVVSRVQEDLNPNASDTAEGKTASVWVVMARSAADLGPLAADVRWTSLEAPNGQPVWSDDYSSILSIFHWH